MAFFLIIIFYNYIGYSFQKHHYYGITFRELYSYLHVAYDIKLQEKAVWQMIFGYKAFSSMYLGLIPTFFIHNSIGFDCINPNDRKIFFASILISGASVYATLNVLNLLERFFAKKNKKIHAPLSSLYLRSFRSDHEKIQFSSYSFLNIIASASFEDFLFLPMRNFTRPVAIGEPGDILPPTSSIVQRYYPGSNEDWREIVSKNITNSDIIFFHLGETDWLRWEFLEICSKNRIKNCMIIFPQKVTESIINNWGSILEEVKCQEIYEELKSIDLNKTIACFFCSNGEALLVESINRNFADYQSSVYLFLYNYTIERSL